VFGTCFRLRMTTSEKTRHTNLQMTMKLTRKHCMALMAALIASPLAVSAGNLPVTADEQKKMTPDAVLRKD